MFYYSLQAVHLVMEADTANAHTGRNANTGDGIPRLHHQPLRTGRDDRQPAVRLGLMCVVCTLWQRLADQLGDLRAVRLQRGVRRQQCRAGRERERRVCKVEAELELDVEVCGDAVEAREGGCESLNGDWSG